ncbi:MAG TPA: RidA family protein [Myxococcales bacterium]|jgi:isochorismate pyruvate lyase
MDVRRAFTGTAWEPKIGYCRAVRAGQHIFVSGCAPVGCEGKDAYDQARRCVEILEKALQELGADLRHVVRTRMFVTDISKWPEFGRAHGEKFAAHPPATTMVEVRALIDPWMLIEIEADAIAGD